jgi:ABC-2 type transport system permease protein
MAFARAILWAQWRTLRNFYPRGGVAWTTIVGVIWYGLWTIAALALLRVFRESGDAATLQNVLPSGLLLVFLYWQLIPLLMASPGASLEWKKLRAYPIPESQLFFVDVLLRFTSGVEMALLLTGTTIGLLLNPNVPKWGALGSVVFIAFNLVIAVGLRDVLGRALAHKRIREGVFLLVVLAAALPQFLLSRQSPGGFRLLRILGSRPRWGWPWTAAAHWMEGIEPAQSIAVLLTWFAVAVVFSWWQFRRTLRFDAEAAGSDARGSSSGARWMELFYQLPSRIFRDPLGILIEKEFRFLPRTPRFRIVFLMGFTFGLLIWLPMAAGFGGPRAASIAASGAAPFFYRNYLTVVSLYSMLLLSEICFWNSFGFDRSAAQFYFLAPVPFPRVLMAKNIAAAFFIALEIAMITFVCALLRMPLGIQRLAEAILVAGVVCLYLLSAGNLQSVRAARGVNPTASFRAGAVGRIQAMLFVVYPIAFAPIALAYLARYAFASQLAFYGVLAVDAAVGMLLYRMALESATATAERIKEKMVASLSAGQSLIEN